MLKSLIEKPLQYRAIKSAVLCKFCTVKKTGAIAGQVWGGHLMLRRVVLSFGGVIHHDITRGI